MTDTNDTNATPSASPAPDQPETTQPIDAQPAAEAAAAAASAASEQPTAPQQPAAAQQAAYAQPDYGQQQAAYQQPTYQQQYGQQPYAPQGYQQSTYQQPYGQQYQQQTYYNAYGQQPDAAASKAAAKQAKQAEKQAKKQARAKKRAEKRAAGTASGRQSSLRMFLMGGAGALVVCVICLGGFALYQSATGGSDGGTTVTIGATSSTSVDAEDTDSTLAEAVAAKCLSSVCSIDVYTTDSSTYYYGYGTDSSSSDSLTQSSLGSGVVLSEDGYILTNYHVIEDSDALEVTIDGTTYEAEVVGYDSSSDIAVIKAVDAEGLTPIEIGDSDNLTVGEWVMSIGSPFGLEQSVATGVVSATSRSQILDSDTDGSYTIYPNMIQTDAAINPGNSGGALVNSDGQLIGINTLITSYSGNYSGVGFAIPVNYAVSIAEQIMNGETPTHAQLGVSLSSVDSTMADRYGLSIESGAYVAAVSEGSGADEAGIQVGDIITAFDGETVESASDLMIDVRTKDPGDTVTVTIYRDGETIDLEVTLGSDEDSTSSTEEEEESSSEEGGSSSEDPFGDLFGDDGSGNGTGPDGGTMPNSGSESSSEEA